MLVVFAGPPHGTDGRDAEKLGNLDGRGGGFMGSSFSFSLATVAVWSIDCARDFTEPVSVAVVVENCLFLSEALDTCDCVLWRATGTAVATSAVLAVSITASSLSRSETALSPLFGLLWLEATGEVGDTGSSAGCDGSSGKWPGVCSVSS